MPKYKVLFKRSADRALKKLPQDVQRRIAGEAALLANNLRPAGVIKMAGDENLWRIMP